MKLEQIICKIIGQYSSSFCYGLIILLKGMHHHIKYVLNLLKDNETSFRDNEIESFYINCLEIKKKRRESLKKDKTSIVVEKVKEPVKPKK